MGMANRGRRWVGWRWRALVAGGLVAVLVALALTVPFGGPRDVVPWAANHFGFALPGAGGLPYRLHYAGRDYATPGECAHASWCAGRAEAVFSEEQLRTKGYWPLHEVMRLPTLFGAARPVLSETIPAGLTTVGLYIQQDTTRYIAYSLEGGP